MAAAAAIEAIRRDVGPMGDGRRARRLARCRQEPRRMFMQPMEEADYSTVGVIGARFCAAIRPRIIAIIRCIHMPCKDDGC